MVDSRFFPVGPPLSLRQIAEVCEATLADTADPERLLTDVAPLVSAGPTDVAFFEDRRYEAHFRASEAGACLVRDHDRALAPEGMALLIAVEPARSFIRIASAFHPRPGLEAGIDASATVDPTARVGTGCRVEAGAVIAADAVLGARCHIGTNAVIDRGVILGEECVIGPCVSLMYCLIGCGVTIHAGARIGQDGFGFVPGRERHYKIPQLGRVIIDDDVEIGANTTIDRGALADTVIGAGTKIDNLVQIGHNVRIGRRCVLVGQVGISGSTVIGDGVLIGGQAGLVGHVAIGDGARIAAKTGVMRDVAPGQTVIGVPAVPKAQFLRQVAILARLASGKKHQ
jgi:UDP-3-O-[3-hydroxymyristoyl] glucosamine N-acyltransferase